MDDCIDVLGEAIMFSTLEWNAGYSHILVALKDRDDTTFTFNEGTFATCAYPLGYSMPR